MCVCVCVYMCVCVCVYTHTHLYFPDVVYKFHVKIVQNVYYSFGSDPVSFAIYKTIMNSYTFPETFLRI